MRTSAHALAIFYLAVGIAPLFATRLGSMDKVVVKRQDTEDLIRQLMAHEYKEIENRLGTHFLNMQGIRERMKKVQANNGYNNANELVRHLDEAVLETIRHHDTYTTRRNALNHIPRQMQKYM
ncbi:hypothetical protein F5148DRAFT_801352 [Russula earlei]|uniref:Uncharacterized protein n=1 Tax=Russula earlei TaxID=71964 RepID=A0ACC0UBY4_9AGAM|nr:hypothetical protein F5148DRAFT_801352 [Russula earlei]